MRLERPKTSCERTESDTRGGRFSWRALIAIARRQHGVITLEQLVALGLTASAVRNLVAAGKLGRVHQNVYAVGAIPLTRAGRFMAAVLACGEGALLASRSAALHLGLRPSSRTAIDVISPRRTGKSRNGIDVHAATLLPRDVTVVDGIPCTSVACTLLHLAALVPHSSLLRALEQAEIERVFDLRAIDDILVRNRGRRGAKRLRTAVAILAAEDHRFQRNNFERRFLPITARAGLGLPLTNHWIEDSPGSWLELDFYWPDLQLAVETDGDGTHGTRSGRRSDRSKDRRLAAVGILTVRYMWEDLDEPGRLAAELIAVAGRRAAALNPRTLSAQLEPR